MIRDILSRELHVGDKVIVTRGKNHELLKAELVKICPSKIRVRLADGTTTLREPKHVIRVPNHVRIT